MEKEKQLSVAAIRSLVIDMIGKAKSGHPGMAIGSAPFLYVLFNEFLTTNPREGKWFNRDRFVLASGHASSLLYSLLHLSGFNIKMEDIQQFRQIGSLTPGHPEVDHTDGVDATSGPLGQGVAQAVGVALAEKILAAKYNNDNFSVIDHYTYALCGDGDIQEGITQEAIALAGLWQLNKLVLVYDSNQITLDGPANQSLSEDVAKRFLAHNWRVLEVHDGENLDEIRKALKKARKSDKPTLIINHTIIGYGSVNQGSNKVHGAPLAEEDAIQAKKKYNYPYGPFQVPDEVYQDFKNNLFKRGEKAYRRWKRMMSSYTKTHQEESNNLHRGFARQLTENFAWPTYPLGFKEASRNTSQAILNLVADNNPNLIGGSADVAHSVMTRIKSSDLLSASNMRAKNIQFGVREFGMASIANGVLIHGGLRTFVGSFMVFSDYLKPAVRMSAIENLPAIYLFSHDSIAVGEDGPTHQPIEQAAMLRAIPNLITFRPADANEVVYAYRYIVKNNTTPISLLLSRQNLEVMAESNYEDFVRGAYYYSKSAAEKPPFTILATGSEVNLALKVKKILKEVHNLDPHVVSVTSMELLRNSSQSFKKKIIGNPAKNFAIEMLSPLGWHEFASNVIGISTFGASGKFEEVMAHFGFTPEKVATRIMEIYSSNK